MSNIVGGFWSGLTQAARIGIVALGALVLAGIVWIALAMFSQDFGVLFSDLSESDAASIVAQLQKDKTPYRLSDDGTTISVPVERVHEVRLGLMSSELPLSGGVGFEIFDKQGLGATEHSQKVSYQRALQGELARTIGALDNVKHVRVHLVMAESTLFTRDRQEASAAVTVATKSGTSLERAQIAGIQRLIAAAVPGLDSARVVVNDQRGITLSAADGGGSRAGAVEARLDVKRQVEEYVAQKIVHMLDGAFGPGQAIVSVDAALNFDATKTTIRDLLPSRERNDGEGRVVRRRQVTGSSANDPVWTAAVDGMPAAGRTPGSSTEIEYEYGQRIDEIIAAPGTLSRISVGVIVPGELDELRKGRIAELVRMAAGISDSRGDALSIQSLQQMQDVTASPLLPERDDVEADNSAAVIPSAVSKAAPPPLHVRQAIVFGAIGVALILAMMFGSWRGAKQPRLPAPEDRERILEEIRRALAEDASGATGRTR